MRVQQTGCLYHHEHPYERRVSMESRIEGDDSDSLLSPTAVAQMLGLSARHVLRLPIKQLRLGHHTVRYRRSDVEAFLERRTSGE